MRVYDFEREFFNFRDLETNRTIYRLEDMRTHKLRVPKETGQWILPRNEQEDPPCEAYYPEASHVCDQHAVIFDWQDDKPIIIQYIQRLIGCVFLKYDNDIYYQGDSWRCEHMILPLIGITTAFNNTSLNDRMRIEFLSELIQDHNEHRDYYDG